MKEIVTFAILSLIFWGLATINAIAHGNAILSIGLFILAFVCYTFIAYKAVHNAL